MYHAAKQERKQTQLKLFKSFSALLIVTLTSAIAMFAQTTSGALSGVVQDANGAVIAGAKVVATHVPTNTELPTKTNEAGLFVYPNLAPGPYSISVEQAGFKKLVRAGIEIRMATRQDVTLKLELGDVKQSIEVTAETPVLETVLAERGQNVSPQVLRSLPIYNGGLRSAESFVGYMPGVNSNSETSINGSNGRSKEVEIDGASMTSPESGGLAMQFPGFEAFQEMKLVTSTFNAEFGRLGGGLEMFATKSGTNMLHGAAFLNMKRDVWDAAGWGSNSVVGRKAGYRGKERYNEEGFAVGGPAYIPKIYDGRNKTFFYLTVTKDIRPATVSATTGETVPTSLMKAGTFTEAGVNTIYDPATAALNASGVSTRTPFAGNAIPKSRWSSISTAMLPYIPDPSFSGISGNYSFLATTTTHDTITTLKADHAITQGNRVSFFMTHRTQSSIGTSVLPGPLSNGLESYQKPDDYRVNHDLVIKPTVLLHSTFGMSRTRQSWNNPLQNGYASKFGLPLTGVADATPIVTFATNDFTMWGMNQGKVNNGGQWNTTIHFNQQLSWVKNKHEFKFGWDIRRLRTLSKDWAGTNGSYTFSSAQTALNSTSTTTTGNSFASFLLGGASSGSATATPVTPLQARYGYHSVFFQDNWRLTPNFTLNYGVRYEIPVGWHDVDGNYSNLDIDKPNPGAGGLPGALVFAGYGPGRSGVKRFYPTDLSSIGPRAGFAYRAGNKTTIRGGFGIFYQALGNGGCGCQDGFNGSYSQTSDGFASAFNWDQGGVKAPAGFKAPPQIDPSYDNFNTVYRQGPNYGKAPRIYNWSFTVQREIKQFLIEAAYVGNRGHGLNSTVYMNQLPTSRFSLGSLLGKKITDASVVAAGYTEPFTGFSTGWGGGATLAQALRPYPQFGTVVDVNAGVGKTWYDSLQTKVERKFGSLQLVASYVYSKSLALMTYRQIFSQGSQVQTGDSYNINDAKSYSYFDIPHMLNILTSYELPFGKGKKFLSSASRTLDLVAGGWTISGAQQYRNGGLIQVVTSGNPNGSGVLFTPITKGMPTGKTIRTGIASTDLDPNDPTKRWFNTGANAPFVSATSYTLGTAASYYKDFRNPWYRSENFSIQKDFRIWETIKLQYRADAINLFNRTAFGGINGTLGSISSSGTYSNSNFGRATGVQIAPRVISMGVRVEF
jgi:hypothetical protein